MNAFHYGDILVPGEQRKLIHGDEKQFIIPAGGFN